MSSEIIGCQHLAASIDKGTGLCACGRQMTSYIVESDPLLSTQVWALDDDDAAERAQNMLAGDDFSTSCTSSDIPAPSAVYVDDRAKEVAQSGERGG